MLLESKFDQGKVGDLTGLDLSIAKGLIEWGRSYERDRYAPFLLNPEPAIDAILAEIGDPPILEVRILGFQKPSLGRPVSLLTTITVQRGSVLGSDLATKFKATAY